MINEKNVMFMLKLNWVCMLKDESYHSDMALLGLGMAETRRANLRSPWDAATPPNPLRPWRAQKHPAPVQVTKAKASVNVSVLSEA